MPVNYRINIDLPADKVIAPYRDSGLNRPIDNPALIAANYTNSNLVINAWYDVVPVGVARSVSDLVHCCYLSDLAVLRCHQGKGIGRELVARSKAHVGDGAILFLLSATGAMSYYPHLAMDEVKNGFIINRKT